MQITLKIQSFDIDADSDATVHAYQGEQLLGSVRVDFDLGERQDQHRFTIDLPNLPHYTQAKIIYEGSLLIDAIFDPDADDAPSAKLITI